MMTDKRCAVLFQSTSMESGPLPTKRVFFVRHGESQWNRAQRRHNILAMVSAVDHPLTSQGAEQARWHI